VFGPSICVERSAGVLVDSTVRGWVGLGVELRVGQGHAYQSNVEFCEGAKEGRGESGLSLGRIFM